MPSHKHLQAAIDGEAYLEQHGVPALLNDIVGTLLASKPEAPLATIEECIKRWSAGEATSEVVPVAPSSPKGEGSSPRKKSASLKAAEGGEEKPAEDVDLAAKEKTESGEKVAEDVDAPQDPTRPLKAEDTAEPAEEAKGETTEKPKEESPNEETKEETTEKPKEESPNEDAKEETMEKPKQVLAEKEIQKIHSAIRWGKPVDEIEGVVKEVNATLTQAVQAQDPKNGNRAVHIAAQNGHIDIVRFLIDNTADVNVQNNKGQTPLHMSVEYDFYFQCLLLIEAGADKLLENGDGHAAINGIEGTKTGGNAFDSPMNLLKAACVAPPPKKAHLDKAFTALEEASKSNPEIIDKAKLTELGLSYKKKLGADEWDHPRFMALVKVL